MSTVILRRRFQNKILPIYLPVTTTHANKCTVAMRAQCFYVIQIYSYEHINMFLLECFLACELTDAASTAVPNSSKSHFFFYVQLLTSVSRKERAAKAKDQPYLQEKQASLLFVLFSISSFILEMYSTRPTTKARPEDRETGC